MDPMSPLDASFLYIENENNHMHIAVVAIFEGPPPRGEEIEEMIASKLDQVPRYRQKVRFVPFDVGRPVWSDDHHFNLRYHVRHTALPSPGTDEQLQTLVGRVMSQQLDRSKPLWETWIVEGLEDGSWAMLSKTHHCMVDGVSGSDLLSVLLDEAPDVEHPPPRRWKAGPRPSAAALVGDAMLDSLRRPREGFAMLRKRLSAPGRLLHDLEELAEGFRAFRSSDDTKLESSLNGPIGPHRRWLWARTTVADVKKIRGAHGGTLNDVVLAAIALGFRELMRSRGEPLEGFSVRTLVPVSIRKQEERGVPSNRISAMLAELPMDIGDPVECLAAIREEMDGLKEHHQADATEALNSITGLASPVLLAMAARLFADFEQHAVQTVTTNVPGPRATLYAGGRRMRTAYPYVPLFGSVRIGVAIFSYAGHLTFGITGDYETAADIEVLAEGIEAGITNLLAAS